ncbi:MAG TPA: tRNA pseudouridine(38-40) synthase TruA [Acidimicrobiales bacterium]|jgi:tRNA pseudouridine38-40 synthase|nr:tRNA pseudouridine(38-40) synthase TruA [Acidimicrobiales bacterium]
MTLFEPSEVLAAPVGPLVRVRMTVAYDGSGFHGFAPNPGVRTVGGTLREAIEKVTRSRVELTCAGRTDTGVHAWGQVVSFDLPAARFDGVALARSLNRLCGPAIVVRDLGEAPDDFDARRSATGRTYRYTIVNRPVPDPFLAPVAWHVEEPLDLDLLRLGCDPLVGEHDFSAFCRKPKHRDGSEASLVRQVRRAAWTDVGDGVLRFEIEADAFCHQMIRSVVGTLVDVGLARKHAGELLGILAGRDRSKASPLAPPQGLCLWAVAYP